MTIDYLLLESGDFLLKEDGDNFLLESSAVYTLIASGIGAGGANGSSVTGLDMTGADLIVICTCFYSIVGEGTVSDSQMNVYADETGFVSSDTGVNTHYKQAPSVSASMDFTFSGVGSFGNLAVFGFQNSIANPRDDISNNTNYPGTGTTLSTDNVHLNEDAELLIVQAGFSGSVTTPTGDSGLISPVPLFVDYVGGDHFGLAVSYKLGNSAGVVNSTFTWTNSVGATIRGIGFKSTTPAVNLAIPVLMRQYRQRWS